METISNKTCCKCQHCGQWTNHAGDINFILLLKERDELQQYKTLYHEWAEGNEIRLEKNRDELAAYSKKLEYKLADMGVMPVDNKPSTSLQQHDNEVIERCTVRGLEQLKHMSPTLAVEAIRALKDER